MTQNNSKPVILTIAANDCAGMAGITMDVKTQQAFGVHSLVVITANTAQNNSVLLSVNPVDASVLKQQLDALAEFAIDVVKVGMLANIAQVKVVREFLLKRRIPMILDPVFATSSGFALFPAQDIAQYVNLLLPLCYLITPNLAEASLLTYQTLNLNESIQLAGDSLLMLGAANALIKGGHAHGEQSVDYFVSKKRQFWLTSQRQKTQNTRGTGCALASSIASCKALGYAIEDAVVIGKMAINQGFSNGYSVAEQKGPVAITHFPDTAEDLPLLVEALPKHSYSKSSNMRFPDCNQIPLGLYPVVDRAIWLERLLPLGVTTIQLRVKDLSGEALELEIQNSVAIARRFQARLFINDHWLLAIKYQAYGVHLGQEDLDDADMTAIHKAGLRLGISTHCHYEVARAMYWQPSYIACGPIFPTNSKEMPWIPHGVEGLIYWRKVLSCPLVAIGGINSQRASAVKEVGVDGIAMISAITEADNFELSCTELLSLWPNSEFEKERINLV